MALPTVPTQSTPPVVQTSSRPISGNIVTVPILLILIVGISMAIWKAGLFARISHPTATASQPTIVTTPRVCKNAWQREERGIGNHANEGVGDFDIQPTNGCFGEWDTLPSSWADFDKEFVPGGDECRIWFHIFGQEKPIGPFGPNDMPEFHWRTGQKFRVATNCTIKFFRNG